MAKWKAPLEDVPMSLGDHLHELRRRLIIPVVAIGVLFLAAFAIQNDLKLLVAKPMDWAYYISPENAEKVGLKIPIKFILLDVLESPLVSMSVSFYASIFVAFPILVYQLWMFIGVGLMPKERRLAFLFIPAGIMFFYAGAVLGYFIGLPHYYAWMIKWAASDPTAIFSLDLRTYHSNFVLMTIIFGLIMDIPWLIMVLVRVGMVTVKQLSKHRKIAFMVIAVIAALIAPPDAFSMIAMMVPLYALFELGLILSRIMMWHHNRLEAKEAIVAAAKAAKEQEIADKAAAAERAARVLTPVNETSFATPSDDAPVPRDHATASPTPANDSNDGHQNHDDHVDDGKRDPSELSDVDADHHRDHHHDEPVINEQPTPRGMDEAGMFTEDSSAQESTDDYHKHHPESEDRRD
jgi:sec-independent protein translocase protein TatC